MNRRKFLRKLLQSQTNVRFADVVWLAEGLGFRLSRVAGSHHIYAHPSIPAQLNLQNVSGQAKPYQIKQLLKLIERYDLTVEETE
jgi:predicted RNA binding protein YcfA (HicA-like mRNA interferase family)